MIDALDAKIAALREAIAKEDAKIAEAVDSGAVGDGHWKRRYQLRNQLASATAVRDAVCEVLAEVATP